MKLGNLKGALLEYLVRNLLKNCGFTNARADTLYTFESNGLFFVNGRGAAHDADVLMDPPIQIPFAYPTRLLFECKAYAEDTGLSIIRNTFGLRTDLNEFEIVTEDSLKKRQNSRRASYAIEPRKRYYYQVGVACVNAFSRPAVEFAANSKIPLLSLSWFVGKSTIDAFNNLTQFSLDQVDKRLMLNLYKYLKDREGALESQSYEDARRVLEQNQLIGDIVSFSNAFIKLLSVALVETGDLIFLHPSQENAFKFVSDNASSPKLKAKIHYMRDRPNIWLLTIFNADHDNETTAFEFFVPDRIFDYWKQFNLDKTVALNMKQQYFSRIFIFGKYQNREPLFLTVTIDQDWLDRARIY